MFTFTVYRKTANTSRVSYISSWVSNTSLGSKTDVLIEAGSQTMPGLQYKLGSESNVLLEVGGFC